MSSLLSAAEYTTDGGGPGPIPPGYPSGTIPVAQPGLGIAQPWVSPKPHTPGTSFQKFRVLASSDVTGTVQVLQSWNGTNWFITDSSAVAADYTKATVIEAICCANLVKAAYVNGAAPQTHFTLITSEVAGAAA